MGWIAQLVPSHRSANELSLSAPTTVHARADTHDTANKRPRGVRHHRPPRTPRHRRHHPDRDDQHENNPPQPRNPDHSLTTSRLSQPPPYVRRAYRKPAPLT